MNCPHTSFICSPVTKKGAWVNLTQCSIFLVLSLRRERVAHYVLSTSCSPKRIANYVKILHKKWWVLLNSNYCLDCLHTCITSALYQNTHGLKHRFLKPFAVSNSCFSLPMNMVTILTILLQQEQYLWTFHTEKLRVVMTFIRLASKSAYKLHFSSDATWLSSGFIFVHLWSQCTKVCHYSVSWCSGRNYTLGRISMKLYKHYLFKPDHTMAHTVSFWLPPTAQTHVWSQASPYRICGGQIGRHIFLQVIQPLPVRIIAPMFHTHWIIHSFTYSSIHQSLTLYILFTWQCVYTLKIWFIQSYSAPYFTTPYNPITCWDPFTVLRMTLLWSEPAW